MNARRLAARVVPAMVSCVAALLVPAAAAAAGTDAAAGRSPPTPRDAVALGRHLVQIAGCNDCHSPGYMQKEGNTPESTWLTGSDLGWQGPWGTTYAINLRLDFAKMSEQDWLREARTMRPRPPMPWFNVRAMTDAELRGIYRYIRSLGPAGEPAPAYVPPGQPVKGPVVKFP